MTNIKPIKQKPIIKAQVINFFSQFRPGDQFRSEDIVKWCKRHMGLKYIYGDTVLRHCRELRAEGRINYTCTFKQERIIKVIAPGDVHSR